MQNTRKIAVDLEDALIAGVGKIKAAVGIAEQILRIAERCRSEVGAGDCPFGKIPSLRGDRFAEPVVIVDIVMLICTDGKRQCGSGCRKLTENRCTLSAQEIVMLFHA